MFCNNRTGNLMWIARGSINLMLTTGLALVHVNMRVKIALILSNALIQGGFAELHGGDSNSCAGISLTPVRHGCLEKWPPHSGKGTSGYVL